MATVATFRASARCQRNRPRDREQNRSYSQADPCLLISCVAAWMGWRADAEQYNPAEAGPSGRRETGHADLTSRSRPALICRPEAEPAQRVRYATQAE
jgi:hypothetical protein